MIIVYRGIIVYWHTRDYNRMYNHKLSNKYYIIIYDNYIYYSILLTMYTTAITTYNQYTYITLMHLLLRVFLPDVPR